MVKIKYFTWLSDKIKVDVEKIDYYKLLYTLYDIPYAWDHDDPILSLNVNRAKDGLYLRYLCEEEINLNVSDKIKDECSVLEMLIGLAMRIEDDIMGDGTNRYDIWFWRFIKNLGLYKYDDNNYKDHEVRNIVMYFLEGKISPFGKDFDPRKELWDQAMDWVNDKYFDENVDF